MDLNAESNDGDTPAYIASEKGQLDVLRLLHEAGVDLNAKTNNGYTPACVASQFGRTEVLHLLLNCGFALLEALR